ncbi:hypothetical protein [Candidatus Magnetomonas plexicatena]|uniref:hypothetical protein n=1 Tax=Candidatus Magnetomonas plexicatena TaxID=2552947 RepID=UPI001C78CBEA|nr:hypothetical protein E2O03_011110 [Nitrospirales bacterium LBB_01]
MKGSFLSKCLTKYKRTGVLLDTNLLLLYLVGYYDPNYIKKFKRTFKYSIEDFYFLKDYIERFDKIIITPQVLAEIWNFAEKIEVGRFGGFLISSIPQIAYMSENYIEKDRIISEQSFHYIGVTDTSVILTAKALKCLVLTDDFRSYIYYENNKIEVININHLRQI